MTTKQPAEHGTPARYRHQGCRCQPCTDASNSYFRARYQAIAAGTWQPYVDATPVRRHILNLLEAGFTTNRIAVLSGLSDWQIHAFLRHYKGRSRKHRTARETADKILAIRPETARPAYLNGIGTARRIEALATRGWPMSRIAALAGLNPKAVTDIRRRARVRTTTADAIAAVYDQYKGRKPERNGVHPCTASKVRNLAAANRWPHPRYWDSRPDAIDDPHFTPEYGMTKDDLLAAEAVFLVTTAGLTRADAATQLGKTQTFIDQAINQAINQQQIGEAA
ncbi:hypothetical protein ACFXB3_07115 [Streptomyces sp. NPDC059447]|uniref:hypothetical protein n=1 Tax=Streptomyces sp. NPDC059447 TaxID=3346834 RepID=UPI0036A58BC7